MMGSVGAVAECAVPPGAPSMVDTTLKGLTEMGHLLRSCAPMNWWVQAGLLIRLHIADHLVILFDINAGNTVAADAKCVHLLHRPQVCMDEKLARVLVEALACATDPEMKAEARASINQAPAVGPALVGSWTHANMCLHSQIMLATPSLICTA